ncbi:unnamed protein product, partial [Cochlearia groenlandica]
SWSLSPQRDFNDSSSEDNDREMVNAADLLLSLMAKIMLLPLRRIFRFSLLTPK